MTVVYQVVIDVMALFTVLMGVMRIMDALVSFSSNGIIKNQFRRVKVTIANTYGSSPCSQTA